MTLSDAAHLMGCVKRVLCGLLYIEGFYERPLELFSVHVASFFGFTAYILFVLQQAYAGNTIRSFQGLSAPFSGFKGVILKRNRMIFCSRNRSCQR